MLWGSDPLPCILKFVYSQFQIGQQKSHIEKLVFKVIVVQTFVKGDSAIIMPFWPGWEQIAGGTIMIEIVFFLSKLSLLIHWIGAKFIKG